MVLLTDGVHTSCFTWRLRGGVLNNPTRRSERSLCVCHRPQPGRITSGDNRRSRISPATLGSLLHTSNIGDCLLTIQSQCQSKQPFYRAQIKRYLLGEPRLFCFRSSAKCFSVFRRQLVPLYPRALRTPIIAHHGYLIAQSRQNKLT